MSQPVADGQWKPWIDMPVGDQRNIVREVMSEDGQTALAYFTGKFMALAPVSDNPTPLPFKVWRQRAMRPAPVDRDEADTCPICAEPFKPDDKCATDITEGTCHARCLEGSPVVDLETGEETGGKADTYLYRDVMDTSLDHLPIELDGIARQIGEDGGAWRSCTGCHELNEGVPTGAYSSIMRCHLGLGCHECGGIGAIWDTTDYAAMGDFMASDTPPPQHNKRGAE